jgi:hypothetical protein
MLALGLKIVSGELNPNYAIEKIVEMTLGV